ncbi:hypothetical protein MMSR116_11095 [Methylobacterium mesophilicum SR1.6/6]|uniref:Uncharacterized protein n=1 Tax=Methylobacterium mesophilicum SR1.6/6 TaxID=908290 RepID=A0A6B9FK67_9HYPH|nr:hypothetical protein [Methylobacterium mesophilicum]QGY02359.1 hypothetical protein MMSR116_11095 [Methylobacterium mesophilicum SR1.6/6]
MVLAMSAGPQAAVVCGLCDWRLSLALLGCILALSVFGAGVVVGQMIERDVPPCVVAVWP